MRGRRQKGQYGYRDYRKKVMTVQVLFGGTAILIQLFARNFTDNEAAKNILTVMAVLSVLPTANAAAPLLASLRWRTPSGEFLRRVDQYGDRGMILYDLIVTSKEQIIPIDAVMLHSAGIYAFCPGGKADVRKAEEFLNETFRSRKLKGKVRVLTDETVFLKRLESLEPAGEKEGSMEKEASALLGLSM